VCATFPAARPGPVAWSWLTKQEAVDLRAALHALRAAEVVEGFRAWPPANVREYAGKANALANVVEELLVELPRRQPPGDPAGDDVVLHLGGAR
jgi:hypothetical protein